MTTSAVSHGLVIFDLDGTLFQARNVTVPAVQQTFAANGLSVPHEAEIGSYIGRPAPEYHAWLAGYCSSGQMEAIIAETDRRELELIGEAGLLFPGTLEMLRSLRASGFRLAMSSNAPDDYFAEVLDTQGLRTHFDITICRGTQFSSKVQIVEAILRELPTRSFAVVGDRRDDIDSARAHGGYAVAVSYGFGTHDELAEADLVVGSVSAINGAIRSLLGKPDAAPQ